MEEEIVVNRLARELGGIDPSNYILQNPDKLEAEILKKVAEAYKFLLKLKSKIPEWAANKDILAANIKAIEQCSTPPTAKHKFRGLKLQNSVDLTGGYGIDSYYLAKHSQNHYYNELNNDLKKIVAFNFETLGLSNVKSSSESAEEFLSKMDSKVELIYIDPDRRGDQKQKLVEISACTPNLLDIQDEVFKKSNELIVKYSPMLDHHLALTQLKHVYKIAIIAIKNDVKELVFYANPAKKTDNPIIQTINFKDCGNEVFESTLTPTRKYDLEYTLPLKYLYEPNAAIMKTGQWESIADQFDMKKLAPNSHFFTSDCFSEYFPGRKLLVQTVIPFSKKTIRPLMNSKANVISRNFGQKPEEIRKKLKIKEGDNEFLIFTSDFSGKRIVIVTTKI